MAHNGTPAASMLDYRADKDWRWQEGDLTVSRTTSFSAPGCHDGCGMLIYTDKDGKIVSVEGDPDNPHTMGRLCPRCLAIADVVYSPKRVLHPLKRDRSERGNPDAWERCSWDEAYQLVIDGFQDIIDKYGADKIAMWRGTMRDINVPISRLGYSLGSPNQCAGPSGIACYLPRVSLMGMTARPASVDVSSYFPKRWDDPGYDIPNCVLIWGCDPINSNNIEYQMGWSYIELLKRGTKFVTIDPRVTWMATRSEIHLQLRPGTDAALAMAIAHVIISEDLYDREFVEKWVYGFDQFAERVSEWTPERAAEVCWIDADDIVATARLFAAKKPSHIAWGVAIDMQFNGVATAMAIQALWMITGNYDIPGGMAVQGMPFGIWYPRLGGWGYEDLPEEVQALRVGQEEYPMFRYGLIFSQPDVMLEKYESGEQKGIWIQTTNHLACGAQDPKRWENAMKKAEFIACADIFMTPTAQALADVFMPVATWLEKDSIRSHNYFITTTNKVIEPLGEVKSDFEICMTIGKHFSDHFFPWADEMDALNDMLSNSGLTFEELRERGNAYDTYEYRKYEKGKLRPDGQPGFGTPTGKVELYSTLFETYGYDPLPQFNEPGSSPYSTPEDYKEYPLILITGAREQYFFHAENRDNPYMRQFNKDPRVDIHPETADELGVAEGQWVWIENRRGRCRQRAHITQVMRPGMVSAQSGWWYPEGDPHEESLYGMREVNINNLLDNKPAAVGYGADIKTALCKIYPVEGRER